MSVTEHLVTTADTAATLGSGDLPVLATPRLALWFEMASHRAAREVVDEEHTTVGTLLQVEHLKAVPVGAKVTIHCSKPARDGRRIIFQLRATDDEDAEIGTGKVHRAVVDPARLMAKFAPTETP